MGAVRYALWSNDVKVVSLGEAFINAFIGYFIGENSATCGVSAPVCETVMQVEWGSKVTQPLLQEWV